MLLGGKCDAPLPPQFVAERVRSQESYTTEVTRWRVPHGDGSSAATPRAESSLSNCATPGEVSRSPGTMTAHSRFSRNSFDLICHCPKDDDFASPIWMKDQCHTNANAVKSSGNGPDRIKWLFPCTRIPTIEV